MSFPMAARMLQPTLLDADLDAKIAAAWDGNGKVLTDEEADRVFGYSPEPGRAETEGVAAKRAGESANHGEAPSRNEDRSSQAGVAPDKAPSSEGGSASSRPDLTLKGETESELRAREALQAKDAADKSKRDNAPGPDGFTLTGSDRPADVAEAHGQKPMFARAPVFVSDLARHIQSSKTESAPAPQWKHPDAGNQPGFDVTPAMREHAMSGMPLFKGGAEKPATGSMARDLQQHLAPAIERSRVPVRIVQSAFGGRLERHE